MIDSGKKSASRENYGQSSISKAIDAAILRLRVPADSMSDSDLLAPPDRQVQTKGSRPSTVSSVHDIGLRVREARRAMGMTQQRFADLAGVGRRFLIELEQGKASLEIGKVLTVCQAAGIRIGFIA
jgi:y4mF family transcriptional regulator